MKLSELSGKRVLLVGYGLEGKATEAYLRHYFPSMTIGVADQSQGADYLEKQNEYDLVIKSPGVPKKLMTIPYTSATNIFFANTKGVTVGVTGSKGKSTTSSLIASILKRAGTRVHLVGNIGNPMLSALLTEKGSDEYYVCELSSYQLEDIEYSPHVSVFINFFPEHMDYHGIVENYWNSKARIIKFSLPSDYFVYNNAYKQLVDLASSTKAKAIPFVENLPFDEASIHLLGNHNKDNVRAAVTVGNILGINVQKMEEAVRAFQPLSHRLEPIGTYKGIQFYDDAISTTPQSTVCAIEALKPIGTIFLGGKDRGYDFTPLIEALAQYKIPNIVLFPDSGTKIKERLSKSDIQANIHETRDMEEAVVWAFKNTNAGTVCLLSTASPSYSLWKNFEEKGDLFQKFVKKYGT